MEGSNFKKIKILKTQDIPLYKDIKVMDGSFIYGEKVGVYTLLHTEERKYNDPLVAIVISDNSMEPKDINKKKIEKGAYVLAEMDTPVVVGKIGIFSYNGECLVRKLKVSGKNAVLEAFNENYPEVRVEKEDKFYILGKVIESRVEADLM